VAVEITTLDPEAARAAAIGLGDVLLDCVDGGASVGFMQPFSRSDAETFFQGVADDVAQGKTVLLAAREGDRLVGTVQLGIALPPNQPHRADVKKLLVHRNARNKGVAEALMLRLETVAREMGRTLLVLDTVREGTAERLYARLGWQRTGVIPDYALFPDGRFCDTVVFWKKV